MARGKTLTRESYGNVTLTSHETTVAGRRVNWVARWKDPLTGKEARRRLHVANRDEARDEARKQNDALTEQRAKLFLTPAAAIDHIRNAAPNLRQAIDEALNARNSRKPLTPDHLYNLKRYQEKFLAFMTARFPAVNYWRDLRRTPHVAAYVEQLKADGLKPVSIRHCLEIISLTANYFADEYEEFNYRPLRVLKIAPQLTAPAKNYMTVKQLEQAVAISREADSPVAELAFLLGGYCGLNLREIARLTDRDFDFVNGLVTVRESKNRYRSRTIPAPPFVMEAVRRHLQSQTVADVAGSLFIRDNGQAPDNRFLARPMDVVLHRMGIRYATDEAAKRAKAAQIQRDSDAPAPECLIVPKDVRKTFINLAIDAGCERECLRRYVGHVPADVMSAHYEAFTVDRFKREIVAKVEAYRQNNGHPADTLETTETAIAR